MAQIYTIKARQWVEEIATLTVEADSPQEALDMVKTECLLDDADWSDGDDIDNRHVYAIDEPGKPEVMSFDEITAHWEEY